MKNTFIFAAAVFLWGCGAATQKTDSSYTVFQPSGSIIYDQQASVKSDWIQVWYRASPPDAEISLASVDVNRIAQSGWIKCSSGVFPDDWFRFNDNAVPPVRVQGRAFFWMRGNEVAWLMFEKRLDPSGNDTNTKTTQTAMLRIDRFSNQSDALASKQLTCKR